MNESIFDSDDPVLSQQNQKLREKYGDLLYTCDNEGFLSCIFADCGKKLTSINFTSHTMAHEQNNDKVDKYFQEQLKFSADNTKSYPPDMPLHPCQNPNHTAWWGTSPELPLSEFYNRHTKCKKCYVKQQAVNKKSKGLGQNTMQAAIAAANNASISDDPAPISSNNNSNNNNSNVNTINNNTPQTVVTPLPSLPINNMIGVNTQNRQVTPILATAAPMQRMSYPLQGAPLMTTPITNKTVNTFNSNHSTALTPTSVPGFMQARPPPDKLIVQAPTPPVVTPPPQPQQQPSAPKIPIPSLNDLLLKKIEKVIDTLRAHRKAWPFNQPVDPVKLGLDDYFDVIKKPMDLGTIRDNYRSQKYRPATDLSEDVHLVFSNAKKYNQKNSEIYEFAELLEGIFDQNYKKITEEAEAEIKNLIALQPPPPPPIQVEKPAPPPAPTPQITVTEKHILPDLCAICGNTGSHGTNLAPSIGTGISGAPRLPMGMNMPNMFRVGFPYSQPSPVPLVINTQYAISPSRPNYLPTQQAVPFPAGLPNQNFTIAPNPSAMGFPNPISPIPLVGLSSANNTPVGTPVQSIPQNNISVNILPQNNLTSTLQTLPPTPTNNPPLQIAQPTINNTAANTPANNTEVKMTTTETLKNAEQTAPTENENSKMLSNEKLLPDEEKKENPRPPVTPISNAIVHTPINTTPNNSNNNNPEATTTPQPPPISNVPLSLPTQLNPTGIPSMTNPLSFSIMPNAQAQYLQNRPGQTQPMPFPYQPFSLPFLSGNFHMFNNPIGQLQQIPQMSRIPPPPILGQQLLACSGACLRSFHYSCLMQAGQPANELRPPWLCSECKNGKPVLHYDPANQDYFYYYYEDNESNDQPEDPNPSLFQPTVLSALTKDEKRKLREDDERVRNQEMYYDPVWCMWRPRTKETGKRRTERQKQVFKQAEERTKKTKVDPPTFG
eukprot:TRINITY_DN5611_c0_g1_i1.p1 TRINITY_DN5611_c0_g1~~TRINITY_DN5611_c0_g1_i1.p1  ORF type:complete len:946 (+),score=243.59 TRINITY_DN5611_c0_g1_i1:158-2995(+)